MGYMKKKIIFFLASGPHSQDAVLAGISIFILSLLFYEKGKYNHHSVISIVIIVTAHTPTFFSLVFFHFDSLQTVRNITGKGKSPEGHAEANLDVQYIMVTGQQVHFLTIVPFAHNFNCLS